jgi:hypothetical protein
MTQALAAFDDYGMVLATDSRATRFDAAGRPEVFSVKKLFPLGPRCAILSGGAGVSVPLSLELRRVLARHRGLLELDDIAQFALPFLSQGYGRHLKEHGPEAEGFRRIYFILAGYSPAKPLPGFSLVLLGSEENELPLKVIPVQRVVVMPRNLGMEVRLFQAVSRGAPLEELLRLGREFLVKMAAVKDEVGPPFYFATITAAGFRQVEIK